MRAKYSWFEAEKREMRFACPAGDNYVICKFDLRMTNFLLLKSNKIVEVLFIFYHGGD